MNGRFKRIDVPWMGKTVSKIALLLKQKKTILLNGSVEVMRAEINEMFHLL